MLIAGTLPQHFRKGTVFFIHLHVFYHVSGQVVEHNLIVSLEKVLAIEQQTFHLFAIDQNAAIALQFYPGELTYQGIEHGAFLQLEGIGIEYECIALAVKFHLGSRHRGFTKFAFLGRAVQVDRW